MTLLALHDVRISYRTGSRLLRAVDGVDLEVDPGMTVGLVGESGSGKTTLAKGLVGLVPISAGVILLNGQDVSSQRARERRKFRRSVQLVFQDPYSSLNPRMTVGEILSEAMSRHDQTTRQKRRAETRRLLELVGLSPQDAEHYPFQFSGGQRQRIAIARALAVQPQLLIADEITSSLDVSVQAAILNLLSEINAMSGVAFLLISHNLGVIRYISQRVAVMHVGKIVEAGETEAVFATPRHPYTQALIDAIPRLGGTSGKRVKLEGEVPDPHDPPTGCRFHTRCPVGPRAVTGRTICVTVEPDERALDNPNHAACHFPLSENGRETSPDP